MQDLSFLENKTLICFGDSTTWGDNGIDGGAMEISWINTLKKILPFQNIQNKGIKGSRIAKCSDRHDSFVERLDTLQLNNADYLILFGGVNDFQHSVPLGSFETQDITSFFGALNFCTKKILNTNPNLKMIFATPTKNNFHHPTKKYPTSLQRNDLSLQQKDYVNAIQQVANFYSQPCINLFNDSGISPFIKAHEQFMPDGLHYSPSGYRILGQRIARLLLPYL